MCGDVEDDHGLDDEIFARLLYVSAGHGVRKDTMTAREGAPLAGDEDRPAYMEQLFRRVLNHAVSDLAAVPQGLRAETIANQAVVFARLAGFLAGHLPPAADMTRECLEAMLDGHAEVGRTMRRLRDEHHGHAHEDDHDHDHDHGHGHPHHHH